MDFDRTREVLAALEREQVRYVVFDRVALNLQGLARGRVMPVHKYRDVASMPDRRWRSPGDPALSQAIRHVWDFAQRTTQAKFPPGLYKHRTVEEDAVQQQDWEAVNFAAFLARRRDTDQ